MADTDIFPYPIENEFSSHMQHEATELLLNIDKSFKEYL